MSFELPLTLGHERVGTVAELGSGVRGVAEGDSVAVYGPWGCGPWGCWACWKCLQGRENYCIRAAELVIRPPGLGSPGAMADYLLVDDVRHLIPPNGRDRLHAAPLPKLVGGSTAVVIGAGGLGHLAVQILRATTAQRVRELTGGLGADVVLDFVGMLQRCRSRPSRSRWKATSPSSGSPGCRCRSLSACCSTRSRWPRPTGVPARS
ncbi:alcohol dehydrogenase catalytic domain-containing protein [Saccharopolyspora pogona]|uniref:alcohol dehydrogenase catalytic domain-containing protein n=1 Tax=Saccharopolyspora pogona TaxID=333966 RepID=UPI001CC241F1|nr:alcohol dehydrogenase catalytic domain-containing protein [Saccharopolyspora pogona]